MHHNRMFKIRSKDGNYFDQPSSMISCVNEFYEDLYTSEKINADQMQNILDKINTISFDEDIVNDAGKDIDEIELNQAIYQMKKNKSPGIDGLTV